MVECAGQWRHSSLILHCGGRGRQTSEVEASRVVIQKKIHIQGMKYQTVKQFRECDICIHFENMENI